jgi:hypothetical protein
MALAVAGCSETLDAGFNRHGQLPVDQRNPIVLVNDGAYDNWFGEYAVLLAGDGGPQLAGIVVNASTSWPDIQANVAGWQALVAAARGSGLQNIPDPTVSAETPLVMPANGDLDATQPNRSEGALFIVEAAKRLGFPYRPLVIVTGGGLTDVADAYLIDPTIAQRVVVVSSLGSVATSGGGMGSPNGDEDPWADTIVAQRLRYVQVSAWYDQLTDVTAANLPQLPDNALGRWIASKQPNLWHWSPASDQVAVLAVGISTFTTAVEHVSVSPPGDGGVAASQTTDAGLAAGPPLIADPGGSDWLVTACDGAAATARFWELLLNTKLHAD